MENKKDNIYIYLWKDLNTVYVGRTINPKGRHYAHKHRESEKTYQFSSEHGVEHPKMIIIENDLTLEKGVEREKYWIDYYKNNTAYNVLNKTCGGQIGELSSLTEEERKQRIKKYNEAHRKERSEYYKKYYQEHNKEKKDLRIQKRFIQHFLEAQKHVEQKILKGGNKIGKIIHNSNNYKTYYEQHKEDRKIYAKEYYKNNKYSKKMYDKMYYEKNREKILKSKKKIL